MEFEDPYFDEIPEEVYEDLFTIEVNMGVIEVAFNLNDYFSTMFKFYLEDHNEQADVRAIKNWATILSTRAANYFSRSLSTKINEAIGELLTETIYQAVHASGLNVNLPINREDVLKDRKKGDQNLKERLEIKRGGSAPAYDLSKLSDNYNQVYPQWRDAKNIYRQNKLRSNWHAMVKAEHPELPDDLIHNFGLRGEASPSGIALEHAARMCGVPPHYYTTRHLSNLHNKKSGTEVEN